MKGRAWIGNVVHAWQEGIWDRVCRRRTCPLLVSFRADSALASRPVDLELDLIFRRVVGRRLTRNIVGPNHRRRQSLTDFLDRGAANAQRVLPYVHAHESVLEYGGGVGRLGRWIAPYVRRLVSVDIDPILSQYGRSLSPGVEFLEIGDLPESPAFDGAYSVAVFFHLTLDEQRRALHYVHRRLRPGGWFLVDLKIGPRTTAEIPRHDNTAFTALQDFQALYEPLFTARAVPLFYSGFLLRKRDGSSDAA
jgi:SAM-dependent methyltransferase